MWVEEKRGGSKSPVILKLGAGLIFSVGGIVYAFLKSRGGIKHFKAKPPLCSSDSCNHGENVDGDSDLQDLSLEHNENSNGFISPELEQLLKEYSLPATVDDRSIGMNEQFLAPRVESSVECTYHEHGEHAREIRILRSKLEHLEERKKMLEIQLLEYYGLKEQETALVELQNQLRLNNMETKLYKLKIESLQSDKRRLEIQVADYEKTVGELEAAKAKIKQLQMKLNSEAAQNREQILKLQERVMKLQDREKRAVETDLDVDIAVKKREELEEEIEELKRSNQGLQMENLELGQRLATCTLDKEQATVLKEETGHLRQENEVLRKEIEQLKADLFKEMEDLVYIRWVNACLRYELRNYHPGPGETIARDLSETLSPTSAERAKELILEYASKEGFGDREISLDDFGSGRWSSSLASFLADYQQDDLPIKNLSSNKKRYSNKMKVFSKLMKLLRGKDGGHQMQTPISPLEMAASVGDTVSGDSFRLGSSSSMDVGADSLVKIMGTFSEGYSPDTQQFPPRVQRSTSKGSTDDASLTTFRRTGSILGYDDNLAQSI